jgi:hypothetical protein
MQKGIIKKKDVKEIAPIFLPTFIAIRDIMRLQESKIVAKAKRAEMAASRTASQSSNVPSFPPSTTSTQAMTLPVSSGSTSQSVPHSTLLSRKRSAPDPITLDAPRKRSRQAPTPPSPAPPTTPDQQMTQPADPNYTNTSIVTNTSHITNVSGGTTESKDEESTKVLMNQFLENTLSVLDSEFTKLCWPNSHLNIELAPT